MSAREVCVLVRDDGPQCDDASLAERHVGVDRGVEADMGPFADFIQITEATLGGRRNLFESTVPFSLDTRVQRGRPAFSE